MGNKQALNKFDEPAKCRNCGLECEATDLTRFSLDAYADLSTDYDLFCPRCESDDIKLYKPKEDKGYGSNSKD